MPTYDTNADYQRARLKESPLLQSLDAALKRYQEEAGVVDTDDMDIAFRDLLTDVRHLCDAYGVNFYDVSERAYAGYSEENQPEWRS